MKIRLIKMKYIILIRKGSEFINIMDEFSDLFLVTYR